VIVGRGTDDTPIMPCWIGKLAATTQTIIIERETDDNAGATIGVYSYATNDYFEPGRRKIVVVDGCGGILYYYLTLEL